MRCFTFGNRVLGNGIKLTPDVRFGQVVYLGEEGRGRRYEKVALSQRNPPFKYGSMGTNGEVLNPHVREAHPVKVTLPAKDGRPERVFYILEAEGQGDEPAVLVRVNTYGGYLKNGSGYWKTVAGSPEVLIAGYGAFGDAGRIGGWADGLVVMRPGDVLRIHPTRSWGDGDSALWVDEAGALQTASWADYENLTAVAQAEAVIAEAKPAALPLLFGQMPAFTYSRGEVQPGIKVEKGTTGQVIALGESGRGRTQVELPIVGFEPSEQLLEAAVVKLSEKVTGLTQSSQREADAFLVRMLPLASVSRQYVHVEKLSGEPVKVAEGNFASGTAGYAGNADDSLWVLRSGDAVLVNWSGTPQYVVKNIAGRPVVTHFVQWDIAQAKSNPTAYAAKGKVLFGQTIPSEWIGRVVNVLIFGTEDYKEVNRLETKYEGELISVNPLVLNLGWDGRDRQDITVTGGVWIKLESEKQVKRLEGEGLNKRQTLRAEAEDLVRLANEVKGRSYFPLLEDGLQEEIRKLGQERYGDQQFDLMPTEGYYGLATWVANAKAVMAKLAAVESETLELERRQNVGEILVKFEAWHRRGGATRNGDGWVIKTDGTLRERDSSTVPRFKHDGTYRWNLVEPNELALRWKGGLSAEVAKLPVNGPTEAQLTAVKQIELEIGAPEGLFGFNNEILERNASRLEAIRQVLKRRLGFIPLQGEYEGAEPYEFVQYEAGFVSIENPDERIMRKVDAAAPAVEFANREAHKVDTIPAADGVVEMFVYHKFGHWNLGIQWRELTPEEAVPVQEPPQSGPVTPDMIQGLLNRFSRK